MYFSLNSKLSTYVALDLLFRILRKLKFFAIIKQDKKAIGDCMNISYEPLWNLLKSRNMKKKYLKKTSGISSNIVARMGKDEGVSLETIVKICAALDCKIEEMVEIIRDTEI